MHIAEPSPPDELDDYVRQITRERRRRFAIAGVVAVTVGAIVAILLLNAPKSAVAGDLVANIRGAIGHIEPGDRPTFAAAALAELEVNRLPKPIVAALRSIENAPREQAPMQLARALTSPEGVAMWMRSCAAGPRALGSAMALDRSSAIESFCGVCAEACTRFGHVRANNVVTLAFAILTNDELAHQSSNDPVENELLHMLVE